MHMHTRAHTHTRTPGAVRSAEIEQPSVVPATTCLFARHSESQCSHSPQSQGADPRPYLGVKWGWGGCTLLPSQSPHPPPQQLTARHHRDRRPLSARTHAAGPEPAAGTPCPVPAELPCARAPPCQRGRTLPHILTVSRRKPRASKKPQVLVLSTYVLKSPSGSNCSLTHSWTSAAWPMRGGLGTPVLGLGCMCGEQPGPQGQAPEEDGPTDTLPGSWLALPSEQFPLG